MTFQEVIDSTVERRLAQEGSGFYDDSFMLDIAIDATSDMAYRLGFPHKISSSIVLGAGENSVTPPADMLPNGIKDVLFDDLGLERAVSYGDLRMNAGLGSGAPEFYYWNPLMAPQLRLAPAADDGGTVVVVYQASLYIDGGVYRKPTLASEVWGQEWTGSAWEDGLYPDFMELAVLGTTVGAWRAGVQFDKAEYYEARFEQRMNEAALRLGVELRPPAGDGV